MSHPLQVRILTVLFESIYFTDFSDSCKVGWRGTRGQVHYPDCSHPWDMVPLSAGQAPVPDEGAWVRVDS